MDHSLGAINRNRQHTFRFASSAGARNSNNDSAGQFCIYHVVNIDVGTSVIESGEHFHRVEASEKCHIGGYMRNLGIYLPATRNIPISVRPPSWFEVRLRITIRRESVAKNFLPWQP